MRIYAVNQFSFLLGFEKKIIAPLNSANFSTSDRISVTQKFSCVWEFPDGVLDIWQAEIPKGTPSECTLSIGTIDLQ